MSKCAPWKASRVTTNFFDIFRKMRIDVVGKLDKGVRLHEDIENGGGSLSSKDLSLGF